MKLRPVIDKHGQIVKCIACGGSVSLRNSLADLDGPAFRAYYCLICAKELKN